MKRAFRFAVICLLGCDGIARAATVSWTGNSSDSLADAANWSGTNTPPASDDALVFGAAGTGGLLLNNDLTSLAFNIAGITFNAGAGAFVIGDGTTTANAGNTFTLTGDVTNNSTSLQTINTPFTLSGTRTFTTTADGGDIVLGGTIDGTGSLIAAGTGTLTLTGTNTFTGGTTVDGGTLQLGDGFVAASLQGLNGADGTDFRAYPDGENGGDGSAGGRAAFLNSGSLHVLAGAFLVGGSGGGGGGGSVVSVTSGLNGGNGGDGAAGESAASIGSGAVLTNDGAIAGGSGGSGGDGGFTLMDRQYQTSGNGGGGGDGAMGAAAVLVSSGGELLNRGAITGGNGGDGGDGGDSGILGELNGITYGGDGGSGGDGAMGGSGVIFDAGATLTNTGTITGGDGGTGGNGGVGSYGSEDGGHGGSGGNGAMGGAGVLVDSGGTLTNAGTITGGNGGDGGSGGDGGKGNFEKGSGGDGGSGGTGGAGVLFDSGGAMTNTGTIIGGSGGSGGSGGALAWGGADFGATAGADGVDGSDGYGVVFSGGAGTLGNLSGGLIVGGVSMADYANSVTLETGSTIDGVLDIGSDAGSTLTLTGSGTQIYSAAVTGATSFAGSLIKSGTGTWTLDRTLAYTGTTAINAGTLVLSGALGNTAVTVASGATLGGEGTIAGSLALQDGSSLFVDRTTAGALTVGGDLTLSGLVHVVLNEVPTSVGTGQTLLVLNYNGALTGSVANLTDTDLRNPVFSTATAGQISLTFDTLALTWSGSTSAWDLHTTANWNAGAEKFYSGDAVTFDDSGAIKALTVDGALTPSSVTFANSAGNDYTLTGSGGIIGNGNLTKSGTGTATLAIANTYTGATAINGGTLQLGDGGTTGSLSPDSAITNNATLVFNRSDTITQGTDFGVITGSGSVVQQAGTVILTGANTYTGGTTIAGGATLQLGNGGASGSIAGNVVNNGTFVFDSSDDFTFAPVISGSGGIELDGYIVRLTKAQTYTGATRINSGYLVLSQTANFGLSASTVVSIASGAGLDISGRAQRFAGLEGSGTLYSYNSGAGSLTLNVATGKTYTFAGDVGGGSPNFTLTKTGGGTQVLSGTNSYTLATTVSGGTLIVDGSIASSSLTTITGSGTLGGHGTVGEVLIDDGGTISPGNSPGILTTGNETWSGGGSYVWELNSATGTAGTNWDLLSITGTLALDSLTPGAPFTIAITSLDADNNTGAAANFDPAQSYTWTLVSTTDGISGFSADKFEVDSSAFANAPNSDRFSLGSDGTKLTLTYSAVPEPPEAGLSICLVCGMAIALRMRRKSRPANFSGKPAR